VSLYVYGVVPAGLAEGHVVTSGDLAALVREIGDHTPGTREDLEDHRRVLGEAIERGDVIPMRFGMVMDDEAIVRERLLEAHRDELARLLRELAGYVQMTVRAYYAQYALLRAAVAGDEEIARRSAEAQTEPERVALGELIAAAVDARRAHDEEILTQRLRPLAADLQIEDPGSDRVALSAQLLVQRERRGALDAAVAELGRALEGYLSLRYLGPLPPYSFAALELEGAGAT
jgi:Gas vesicle synthesis protein GvpL/GvpF